MFLKKVFSQFFIAKCFNKSLLFNTAQANICQNWLATDLPVFKSYALPPRNRELFLAQLTGFYKKEQFDQAQLSFCLTRWICGQAGPAMQFDKW